MTKLLIQEWIQFILMWGVVVIFGGLICIVFAMVAVNFVKMICWPDRFARGDSLKLSELADVGIDLDLYEDRKKFAVNLRKLFLGTVLVGLVCLVAYVFRGSLSSLITPYFNHAISSIAEVTALFRPYLSNAVSGASDFAAAYWLSAVVIACFLSLLCMFIIQFRDAPYWYTWRDRSVHATVNTSKSVGRMLLWVLLALPNLLVLVTAAMVPMTAHGHQSSAAPPAERIIYLSPQAVVGGDKVADPPVPPEEDGKPQVALSKLGEEENKDAPLGQAPVGSRNGRAKIGREDAPPRRDEPAPSPRIALTEKREDLEDLQGVIEAYRKAINEIDRWREPYKWGRLQHNLGNALIELGERKGGTALLEQAAGAYSKALEECNRHATPTDWAMSFGNQGAAVMLLAERTESMTLAERAVVQIEAAFRSFRASGHTKPAAYYERLLFKAIKIRDEQRKSEDERWEGIAEMRKQEQEKNERRVAEEPSEVWSSVRRRRTAPAEPK